MRPQAKRGGVQTLLISAPHAVRVKVVQVRLEPAGAVQRRLGEHGGDDGKRMPQEVDDLWQTHIRQELPNGEGGGPWQAHSSWSWAGLLEACRREGMPQGSVAGPSDSCRRGAWGAGLPQEVDDRDAANHLRVKAVGVHDALRRVAVVDLRSATRTACVCLYLPIKSCSKAMLESHARGC